MSELVDAIERINMKDNIIPYPIKFKVTAYYRNDDGNISVGATSIIVEATSVAIARQMAKEKFATKWDCYEDNVIIIKMEVDRY